MDTLDWLLEDDAPGVAFQARSRLLDEDPESAALRRLRQRVNEDPAVAGLLERVDDAIAAGNYKYYRGAFWTLIFLAEMAADGRDPRARRLAEHVLAAQLPNGGFSATKAARNEIVCLTANLLRALVHLGWGEHEGVHRGYRRLAERIVPNGGVPCFIIDARSLLDTCKMTLPQTLRSVAAAPPSLPATDLEPLRDVLLQRLIEIRVYRYVHPDGRKFYKELVPQRPKGVTIRAFKETYRQENPVSPEDLLPKEGWRHFGFPSSYDPDLLEAMLALAELGVDPDPVFDEALDVIEEARGADGRWRLERSLDGKMLVDIERQGEPSKWLTLRALFVLRHFGRWSRP